MLLKVRSSSSSIAVMKVPEGSDKEKESLLKERVTENCRYEEKNEHLHL